MSIMDLSIVEMLTAPPQVEAAFGRVIPAERILVLSPHPDDEVLGCGGTLLKYLEQGANITILYLTDGRYGVSGGDVGVRKAEALSAWDPYSNVKQIFWDFTDSRLMEQKQEAVRLLKENIEAVKPQVVFTPWVMDRHTDHTAASLFLSDALQLLPDIPCSIASYEIAFPLYANHVVNITKQWEQKMALVDVYESQLPLNIKAFITSLNIYRAQLARFKSVKSAEAFLVMDQLLFIGFIQGLFTKRVNCLENM